MLFKKFSTVKRFEIYSGSLEISSLYFSLGSRVLFNVVEVLERREVLLLDLAVGWSFRVSRNWFRFCIQLLL